MGVDEEDDARSSGEQARVEEEAEGVPPPNSARDSMEIDPAEKEVGTERTTRGAEDNDN